LPNYLHICIWLLIGLLPQSVFWVSINESLQGDLFFAETALRSNIRLTSSKKPVLRRRPDMRFVTHFCRLFVRRRQTVTYSTCILIFFATAKGTVWHQWESSENNVAV
jgi:hypothetical protein